MVGAQVNLELAADLNIADVAAAHIAALPQIDELVAAVLENKESVDANNLISTGWRIEVTHRGRYYFWRRGSGANRESETGGKFAALSDKRKAEYRKNSEALADRKRHRHALANTATSD
jgi:hypothetical protein